MNAQWMGKNHQIVLDRPFINPLNTGDALA